MGAAGAIEASARGDSIYGNFTNSECLYGVATPQAISIITFSYVPHVLTLPYKMRTRIATNKTHSVNSRRIQNPKCLVWCRLQGKSAVFSLLVGLFRPPSAVRRRRRGWSVPQPLAYPARTPPTCMFCQSPSITNGLR